MGHTFVKLFSSITDSTVWGEPDSTRLVWITMLAMTDQHGHINASVPGLAHRARVPIGDCEAALRTFLSPDPYSRTAEYDGRRIEVIDGGWRLLNYQKYREFGNPVKGGLDAEGYVYFIGIPNGEKIKIGFSKNPWARLDALRTTEPGLDILATERGTRQGEKDRHNEFKAERLDGEWFRASPSLLSLVLALSRRDERVARGPRDWGGRTTTVVVKTTTVGTEEEAEADREEERAKQKAKADAPSAKRGQRLAPDWQPSDADVAFAVEHRVNWRQEAEAFRDYWCAKSGADAAKLDWSATWRNWVRRSRKDLKPATLIPAKSKTRQAIDNIGRMINAGTLVDTGDWGGAGEAAGAAPRRLSFGRHDRSDGGDLD